MRDGELLVEHRVRQRHLLPAELDASRLRVTHLEGEPRAARELVLLDVVVVVDRPVRDDAHALVRSAVPLETRSATGRRKARGIADRAPCGLLQEALRYRGASPGLDEDGLVAAEEREDEVGRRPSAAHLVQSPGDGEH